MQGNHSFNVVIAQKYSIEEALLLAHIHFWCEINMKNKRNCFNNKYWTYNTYDSFTEVFPYFTARQIRTILEKLEKHELIETGNFNKLPIDKTKWYTVSDKGIMELKAAASDGVSNLSDCQNGQLDCQNGQTQTDNSVSPSDKNVRAIPDINTDINLNSISSELTNESDEVNVNTVSKNSSNSAKASAKKKKKSMNEEDVNNFWSNYSSDTRTYYEGLYRDMYRKAIVLNPSYKRTRIQCLQNAVSLFNFAKSEELDMRELRKVVDFGLKDSFWCPLIVSPSGFIKHYEKLVMKMNSAPVKYSKKQSLVGSEFDSSHDYSSHDYKQDEGKW